MYSTDNVLTQEQLSEVYDLMRPMFVRRTPKEDVETEQVNAPPLEMPAQQPTEKVTLDPNTPVAATSPPRRLSGRQRWRFRLWTVWDNVKHFAGLILLSLFVSFVLSDYLSSGLGLREWAGQLLETALSLVGLG